MPKPAPAAAAPTAGRFAPSTGGQTTAQRVVLYGTGGVGKSTLAASLAQAGRKPLVLDVEDGCSRLDIPRLGSEQLPDWLALRAALTDNALWQDYDTLVLDSISKAEDMLADHICKKGNATSLANAEGGFGKGYALAFQEMVGLLSLLESHTRAGRTVVLICHATTGKVPNPSGEDFLQTQPRLYHADKCSLREKVKEWADHVALLGYDIESKGGKGKGTGTRTVFLAERPSHVAKTRGSMPEAVPLDNGADFWRDLLA